MTRLWDKGGELDPLVHRFTVGDDPRLDLRLIHFDCLGSAATRSHVGASRVADARRGRTGWSPNWPASTPWPARAGLRFPTNWRTAIRRSRAHLTAALGELGGKIHAGRSRNDQVATAMRLLMRHHAMQWTDAVAAVIAALAERIGRDGDVPMPGYTHMQPAMPSSVGLWLACLRGSAAGATPRRRSLARPTRLLPAGHRAPATACRCRWIAATRRNCWAFPACNAIRWTCRTVAAGWRRTLFAWPPTSPRSSEKLSGDLILFSTAEFGFFSLPEALTTGSSIMPQKQNPDVLELIRAHAGRLRAHQHELEWLAGKLPSGYHRDLQLTKGPTIDAVDQIAAILAIIERVVQTFAIHGDRLAVAMRPELFATHAALQLARNGTPFREAYRQVADSLRSCDFHAPRVVRVVASTGDATRHARSDGGRRRTAGRIDRDLSVSDSSLCRDGPSVGQMRTGVLAAAGRLRQRPLASATCDFPRRCDIRTHWLTPLWAGLLTEGRAAGIQAGGILWLSAGRWL